MRVFLCVYSGFSLAIPMSSVSALSLFDNDAPQILEYKQENGNSYISLPRLFDLPEEIIRHGIILKNGGEDNNDEDYNIKENRTVLLTTEVKCETEISDTEIYPLPKIFGSLRFSRLFSGIQFASSVYGSFPVLLLNPGQLLQSVNKTKDDMELSI